MMNKYTVADVLRLAKRWQNAKRSYLLVNPLQAKHLPAEPSAALQMAHCLGRQVAANYPQARLVIGFAETATALGAAVAACLGSDCVYIQTTREDEPLVQKWLNFQEEHSHAVEQKLCADNLAAIIANSPQIIFVDDEISTGKTLLNIVGQLKQFYPQCQGKEMVAASIINRLQPENEQAWAEAGLRGEYLVRPEPMDYELAAADFVVSEALPPELAADCSDYIELSPAKPYLNSRLGVLIGDYQQNCWGNAQYLAECLAKQLVLDSKILVLGTEEFMYPALILAEELARRGKANEVCCHATTRSPIGVSCAPGYPINNGCRLHSFYAEERTTYIYNLAAYDAAVVLTDSQAASAQSLAWADLQSALRAHGCRRLFYVRGGQNV